jgi:hypothetical protein
MGIFLKDISSFIQTTEAKQNHIVAQIIEEVCASVVELSPVVSGNFMSNWLLGLDNNIPWGVTGFKNPDKKAKIDRLIARIPADAANHNYNLVNNTSYAIKLETGEGMQRAPYAMIGITEVRLPSIVRRVIKANGVL